MHLQFEFTQDDIIDAAQRCLARSKTVRATRMKGLLVSVGLSWLFTFLFFLLVVRLPFAGAIAGLLTGLTTGVIYPGSHQRGMERRLRAFYREHYGDAGPFLCEMEVSPVGIWVRQANTQVTHEWESVEGVEETAGGLEVLIRHGNCVIVRDRAFGSPEERRRFIELTQSYIALAGVGRAAADSEEDRDQLRGSII
jgi:hypothetical protein